MRPDRSRDARRRPTDWPTHVEAFEGDGGYYAEVTQYDNDNPEHGPFKMYHLPSDYGFKPDNVGYKTLYRAQMAGHALANRIDATMGQPWARGRRA